MQTPKLTGLVTGLFAGCALFIEKPSRRIELALYTLSHALQSAAKVRRPPSANSNCS